MSVLARLAIGVLPLLAAASATAQPAVLDAEASRTARRIARTHEVARCLVRDFRPLVAQILGDAPGASAERTRFDQLRRRGRRCVETVTQLDDTQYIASWDIPDATLRGALAEALYESDFSAPGRVRPGSLVRVAPPEHAAPAVGLAGENLADVRRFAACVARSAPDDAEPLLAIEPGSAAETETVRRLVWEFDLCFPTDDTRSINIPTVRGLVAEALYRQRSALARGEPLGPGEQVAQRRNASSGAAVIVPVAAVASGAPGSADSYDSEDVRNLSQFSRCIARRRPADAQELLTMDYRGDDYDRTARAIASRSPTCAPRGRLRFSRLLFAGGLAEEMLAARPSGGGLPAVSAVAPPTPAQDGDITQSVGACLVRSQPASVAGLLATAPASAEENEVVRALTPHVAGCVAPGQVARISQPSLRALTAIAAWRLVQSQEAAPRPGRN